VLVRDREEMGVRRNDPGRTDLVIEVPCFDEPLSTQHGLLVEFLGPGVKAWTSYRNGQTAPERSAVNRGYQSFNSIAHNRHGSQQVMILAFESAGFFKVV